MGLNIGLDVIVYGLYKTEPIKTRSIEIALVYINPSKVDIKE